ncbi:MAG: hypothetical protein A3J93_04460 [Candidatus Magasanikbacteria bacterium RIFOXYC2_FULL_42_28]|uniref:Bacterial sugar transferase domain-containing protein n=1 Tax=Candidatus Magasanikbacteria bacterium RIFOXYC2_FULL_42_28 TaxID=1798704 RepID=A0A1F6NX88_9BACT|nr:MAG: hypothetical protein A3J93_04460 [Candidatus Magasanikbacteria bacterium RIFOXYC2_FULL_42_28]
MYRFKQLTLIGGDLVCLYTGLLLALIIRGGSNFVSNQAAGLISPMTALFLVALVIMFITGLYDLTRLKPRKTLYQKMIIAGGVWAIIAVLTFYLFADKVAGTPKTILALTTIISFGLATAWRVLYDTLLSATLWQSTIIFAGITAETLELCRLLNSRPEIGYRVSGIIDKNILPSELAQIKQYPNSADLPDKLANTVVVSPQFENDTELTKKLYHNLSSHLQVERLDNFYEKTMKRVPPFALSETWFLTNLTEQNKKVYDRGRLLFDYLGAILMALIFIATFPVVAIMTKLTSTGPIFFKQIRTGRNGHEFEVIKYRTMKVLGANGSAEVGGPQFASVKDERITGFGKFLRRTRLDELPQFWNILKNEMAFIGPRPERPEFVKQLTEKMPYYAVRHLIKPGLTGWAQLQHNYYGTLDENLRKLEYDLYYIKNRGALLDLAIVLRTVNVILGMRGR